MMGMGRVSAAYSRPTSTTRQSYMSKLNSAAHKRKKSKQRIGLLKWGADTIIKFSEICNSYEVLWDTSHENNFKKNVRGSDGHDKPLCTKAITIIDNFKNAQGDTNNR